MSAFSIHLAFCLTVCRSVRLHVFSIGIDTSPHPDAGSQPLLHLPLPLLCGSLDSPRRDRACIGPSVRFDPARGRAPVVCMLLLCLPLEYRRRFLTNGREPGGFLVIGEREMLPQAHVNLGLVQNADCPCVYQVRAAVCQCLAMGLELNDGALE
eukprot:3699476-Rhodomonas_salina.10